MLDKFGSQPNGVTGPVPRLFRLCLSEISVSLRKLESAGSQALGASGQRQIASPNNVSVNCSCASGSPLLTHLARPFRIMWTASIP